MLFRITINCRLRNRIQVLQICERNRSLKELSHEMDLDGFGDTDRDLAK